MNSSLEVRLHAERDGARPEPYPIPTRDGVIETFNTEADLRPRFGWPTRRIIDGLWAARFGSENKDAAWASSAEAALLSVPAAVPGLAPTSLDVECRAITCRAITCRATLTYSTDATDDTTGLAPLIAAIERLAGLTVFTAGAKVGDAGVPIAEVYVHDRGRVVRARE